MRAHWQLPYFALSACVAGLLLAAMGSAQAQQTSAQIMQQAQTNGAAASTVIQSAIANTNTSSTPLPNISPNNLTQQGQGQVTACQSTTNNAQCDALNTAVNDAALRNSLCQPVTSSTPSVQAAAAVIQQPTAVIGTFDTSTSSCSSSPISNPSGQPTVQTKSCYDYYNRDIGLTCQKSLEVNITWYCNPGDGNPIAGATPAIRPTCNHFTTTPPVGNTPGQTVNTPYPALPDIYEYWSGCEDYEARVPPGLLLPDGDNATPPPATGPGVTDMCERTNSVCSVPGQTQYFFGIPITAACWQYANTFDCLDQNTQSDCSAPWVASCTPLGSPVCVDSDPLIPGTCDTWRKDFSCPVSGAGQTPPTVSGGTATNCTNQTFSDAQGNVWNIGHPPDTSFTSAVMGSEVLREAGLSLNTTNMTVLPGEDDRCRIALFGIQNCCNSGGTSAFSSLTDRALSGATAAQDGLDPIRDFSNYTYNALFPGSGNLITDITIPPSLWSSLQMTLQMSGLISCSSEEKSLALKRDANLCTDIGEYCSESTPIIHICVQHTHTYCCFNSQLAEAINVQGKAQLGISMGSPQNPNCGGLTVAQLQSLNLSTMNLSAFTNEIAPQPISTSQAAAQANAAGVQSGTANSTPSALSLHASRPGVHGTPAATTANDPPCFYGVGQCAH